MNQNKENPKKARVCTDLITRISIINDRENEATNAFVKEKYGIKSSSHIAKILKLKEKYLRQEYERRTLR